MIIGTGAMTAAYPNGETLKLVNRRNGHVVVEFVNGKAIFHDRFLKPEMEEVGILIPHTHRDEFAGKETVLLDDELFEKAFIEIYFRYHIPHSLYELKN